MKGVKELSLTKGWSGEHLKDEGGSAGDARKLDSLDKYEGARWKRVRRGLIRAIKIGCANILFWGGAWQNAGNGDCGPGARSRDVEIKACGSHAAQDSYECSLTLSCKLT